MVDVKGKTLVNAVSYNQAEAEAGRLKDDKQGDVEAEPLVSNLLEALARSCDQSLVDRLLATLY